MFSTTVLNLKIFYTFIWLSGGLVLLAKSHALFIAASKIQADTLSIGVAVAAGLLIGLLKIIFIFSKSCRRNLNRIERLTQPKIWQVLRPGFMLFLVLMIILGSTASHFALGKYAWLIAIGIVDLSLAVGLLGSSYVFWQNKVFKSKQP